MKVIVTHKKPDVDALVATWLAERFLFDGYAVQVRFVHRSFDIQDADEIDCVVDVGCAHLPHRLVFDHKPPAFTDRHVTCAAKLVWAHLTKLGYSLGHLADLMQVVHDGDSIRLRAGSAAYRVSRTHGLHAAVHGWQGQKLSDDDLYKRTKRWLDKHCTGIDRNRAPAQRRATKKSQNARLHRRVAPVRARKKHQS